MVMSSRPLPGVSSHADNNSHSLIFAAFFLFLAALLSLACSHYLLMWNDEFTSFYTDSVRTFSDLIQVQLHYPICWDPLAYHLLSHASMLAMGRNATALRFPALIGFLLFQICIYIFVRRIAGPRAAVIALAFPLLTWTFHYSSDGRPYGLLIGFDALALVCWQAATRARHNARSRIAALIGLAAAVALAINTHYFGGVLILVPLAIAEAARTRTLRRLDWGVLASLAIGMSLVAMALPFRKALLPYQQHMWAPAPKLSIIPKAYIALFYEAPGSLGSLGWRLSLLMLIVFASIGAAAYLRFRRRSPEEPAHEWVALLAVALLPVFGFLLGRFVTHIMHVRYVNALLFAFAASLGIVLSKALQRNVVYYGIIGLMALAIIGVDGSWILRAKAGSDATMRDYRESAAALAAMKLDPAKRIYLEDQQAFFRASYYIPDEALRSRISRVKDQAAEIRWLGYDTFYVTEENFAHFTNLQTTPYAAFLHEQKPLYVKLGTNAEWFEDLGTKNVKSALVAPLLGGELYVADTASDSGGH